MPISIPSVNPPSVDSTLNWVRSYSTNNIVKPKLVLRMATDQNWLFHHAMQGLPNYGNQWVDAAAMMNCGLPGMRVPGITSWSTTESIDSVTQTATFECVNALPVSQRRTTLSTTMAAEYHSSSPSAYYVKGYDGITKQLGVSQSLQQQGYSEDRLLFRTFNNTDIACADLSDFPDPAIPTDESDSQTYWGSPVSGAVGSYFILIDNEVIRVHRKTGNTLSIPPGGRGVNGIMENHSIGASVILLGFAPFTGEWAGMGYLSNAESSPQKGILRPGTCLVSYEGYEGGFDTTNLTKADWNSGSTRSYEFTGYWFIKALDASLSEDGKPVVKVDLLSAGSVLSHQKITTRSLLSLKTGIDNWTASAFDSVGITRNITGDWVDYKSWDPEAPGSLANGLQIKTELAQHKQFFEHMNDTDMGVNCEYCQDEWHRFVDRPDYKLGSNPVAETRQVGRHIYKESIRVYYGNNGVWDAGPLRTYGKLMINLARFAYEHPMPANPLGHRWTKIPQTLWDNMIYFENDRVWNGQLSFVVNDELRQDGTPDPLYPWQWRTNQMDDLPAQFWRTPLAAPFESTYNMQDWSQPIQDLADLNRMTFLFTRRGEPIFIPRGLNLRGVSYNSQFPFANRGIWYMGWGGSVTNYSYNQDPDSVISNVYVTGTTAFDSEFTIEAAGTGTDNAGNFFWYSPAKGNPEALALTGGVAQVETATIDGLVLGFDWNSEGGAWSLQLDRGADGTVQVSKMPPIPKNTIKLGANNNDKSVRNFKKFFNFLRVRNYIVAVLWDGEYVYTLNEDSDFDDMEEACVKAVQSFLKGASGVSTAHQNAITVDGVWTIDEHDAAIEWAENNEEFIKKDVWWYVMSGLDWEQFVCAIVGLPVPQRRDEEASGEEPTYLVDQLALRTSIQNWQTRFFHQAINIGNKIVEDSIGKATVRTITTNYADPRIQIGDVVYLAIPGYLSPSDPFGSNIGSADGFSHGTYITAITRTMDFGNGTYNATYSGYRYRYERLDNSFGKRNDNFMRTFS